MDTKLHTNPLVYVFQYNIGGTVYITVYAIKSSKFIIRAFTLSTIITLTEEMPFKDIITHGHYHYFRFYDTKPKQDIIFDVYPITGSIIYNIYKINIINCMYIIHIIYFKYHIIFLMYTNYNSYIHYNLN